MGKRILGMPQLGWWRCVVGLKEQSKEWFLPISRDCEINNLLGLSRVH